MFCKWADHSFFMSPISHRLKLFRIHWLMLPDKVKKQLVYLVWPFERKVWVLPLIRLRSVLHFFCIMLLEYWLNLKIWFSAVIFEHLKYIGLFLMPRSTLNSRKGFRCVCWNGGLKLAEINGTLVPVKMSCYENKCCCNGDNMQGNCSLTETIPKTEIGICLQGDIFVAFTMVMVILIFWTWLAAKHQL